MEQWTYPVTIEHQEAMADGMTDEHRRYLETRHLAPPPAAYTPPTEPEVQPVQNLHILPRHIKAMVFVSGTIAVGYSVAAFVAAYAVYIGAVAVGVTVMAVVVSGLSKSDSGANVRTTTGTNEAKQTIINIHVAADGGKVDVNK